MWGRHARSAWCILIGYCTVLLGFLRSAPLYIWNCIFRTWPPHVSVKSWFKNWNCKNTMWQIVNIASPSPLLLLTDKGIEQISSSSYVSFPIFSFFFLSSNSSISSSRAICRPPRQPPVPRGRCMVQCRWLDALTAHGLRHWSGWLRRRRRMGTLGASSSNARASRRGRLDLSFPRILYL